MTTAISPSNVGQTSTPAATTTPSRLSVATQKVAAFAVAAFKVLVPLVAVAAVAATGYFGFVAVNLMFAKAAGATALVTGVASCFLYRKPAAAVESKAVETPAPGTVTSEAPASTETPAEGTK